MSTTTRELARDFVMGANTGSASSNRLRIEGDVLVNYSTAIALRIEGKIILNARKYSPTTSKHQNRVREYADSRNLIEVSEKEFIEVHEGGRSIDEVLKERRENE